MNRSTKYRVRGSRDRPFGERAAAGPRPTNVPSRNIKTPSAFTLLELLITIALIALLVSILSPVLGSVRQRARMTACMTNLRGQAMAVHEYTVDSQGAMPPRLVWNYGNTSGQLINELLAATEGQAFDPPEQGDLFRRPVGIWRCPDAANDQRRTHSGILFHAPNRWLFNVSISYDGETYETAGDALPGWDDQLGGSAWRQLEHIRRPSKIVLMGDNVMYYHLAHALWEGRESIGYSSEIMTDSNTQDEFAPRAAHAKLARRPVAFVDDHIESLPAQPDYWQDAVQSYRPPGYAGGANELYRREVERFMWFIRPEDTSTGAGSSP